MSDTTGASRRTNPDLAATSTGGGWLRARVPADIEAPDRILGDLTARQVAVLAIGAAVAYLAWRALHTRLPVTVLIAAGVPFAGIHPHPGGRATRRSPGRRLA